jgi:hypothetical protein
VVFDAMLIKNYLSTPLNPTPILMTAVIGILNKTAVAVAADSAMTMSKNNKILNTANKLFTLSKFHPVGIVIYNSSAFASIPWEVLIKEYRRQRGMVAQKKLIDYATDFTNYVREQVRLVSEQPQREIVCVAATKLFAAIREEIRVKADAIVAGMPQSEQTMDNIKVATATLATQIVNEKAVKYSAPANSPILDPGLQAYSLDSFLTFYGDPLNRTWQEQLGQSDISEDVKQAAFKVLFEYYKGSNFDLSDEIWSGIGIIGYGDEEVYPGCYMLHFAEIIGGCVRVKNKNDESYQVDDMHPSAILPFAQRDVIQGFLQGVRPDLTQVYYQVFGNLLTGVNAQLAAYTASLTGALPAGTAVPSMQLDVNNLVSILARQTQGYQQEVIINPVVSSVIGLSKDDLAEMAESLIHLTYLHRRINSAPESVGGPIDVAVISKGDGFIWIKRKFYFRPEINPGFIQNYFNLRSPQQ